MATGGMDRKENRSSRFAFSGFKSSSNAASRINSPTVAAHHNQRSKATAADDDGQDNDPLTGGTRYEINRPRTPPKQVSQLGPGKGASSDSNLSSRNNNTITITGTSTGTSILQDKGKGIRAARTRGALANLFPEAAAHVDTATATKDPSLLHPENVADVEETKTSGEIVRGASHELSLSPRGVRDGVVDRMLSSFDRLGDGMNGYDSGITTTFTTTPSSNTSSRHQQSNTTNPTILPVFYADPDRFTLRSRSTSAGRRPRGHTHSSSTSSGFRNTHNKNKSSGSNFYTSLDRVDSVSAGKSFEPRPSTQGASTARVPHTDSSVPLPEVFATVSKVPTVRRKQQVRRSASFDQAHVREVFSKASALQKNGTMDDYDDLNAAPEPSVRSGPRRLGEPAGFSPGDSPSLRGRDGVKTLTGLRKAGASPQRIAGVEASQPSDAMRDASPAGHREAPPIPNNQRPRPLEGSYKATAFSTNTKDGGKEKGGFFKRMFGGSSSNKTSSSSQQDAQNTSSQISDQTMQSRGRSDDVQRQPSLSSKVRKVESGDSQSIPPKTPTNSKDPPTLTKKSSFFRRRKKSIAAPTPDVPSIPDSATWSNTQMREPSPASSLRKVMNPYIGSRPGTRKGRPSTSEKQSFTALPTPPDMGSEATKVDSAPETYDDADNSTTGVPPTPRAAESQLRHSSSKPRKDRPPTSSRGNSYKSARDPYRNDPDASETSDADFISAKSHVNSPVEDARPEMFRSPAPKIAPPAPKSAPPSVPLDEPAGGAKSARSLDPGKTPTHHAFSGVVLDGADNESAIRPTNEDYEKAYKLFHFSPDDPEKDPTLPMATDDICAWLGEAGPDRARQRKAYLEQFDWREISILAALRKFCEHVRLKGETQQVDRILESIARRWTECNPAHGFKAVDVVHTICYSLLLLNTDLHMADIENRMTRSQFIKNTVPTVMRVLDDSVPSAFDAVNVKRASTLPPNSAPLPVSTDGPKSGVLEVPKSPHSPITPNEPGTVKLTIRRNSNEFQRNKYRLSARPSENYALENLLGNPQARADMEASIAASGSNEDCGPLVKQPFYGGRTAWESQLETALKNFYTSIQKQRLPLHNSSGGTDSQEWSRAPSSTGQQGGSGGTPVRRTPSITSKQSDGRGRNLESRGTVSGATSSRWTSRNRTRPKIYAASSVSMDDEHSMSGMSPSASSLWSKHSFGRTQTSMSGASFGSEAPGKEAYQKSIGFANALSQAIIREEGAAGGDDSDGEAIKAAPLLEDESLELYGAPWAKEGIVKHKHHLEAVDKKAKERAWTECFAVIEKGWLRLFRFNSSKTASLRSKTLRAAVGSSSQSMKSGTTSGGKLVVGGGNWMDNALPLGRFLLRQTIASALPPPGYSKSRPHVWALSLPNGAVHLFQAGTPEIVREYVTCANYWSARLSKEPLTGGVSNVEYGWSESLIGDFMSNNAPLPRPSSSSRDEAGLPSGTSSSIAEAFSMKRQRSASASSSATQIPGIPPRSGSRGFGLGGGSRPPSSMHSAKPSLQTSIRSSIETTASAVVRPRLPGDHVKVADWTPPPQSMVASALLEVDQLRVLTDYVANIQRELERHNELRPAIHQAYNPRHPNFARATDNFQKKSSYLLREIVKFSTYVETLQAAQAKKEEVYRERDQRRRELDEERAREASEKVQTAEELRRELSKSDLRLAAKTVYGDEGDDDDVPEVPEVPQGLMNMIS